ncbi:MAG: DNA polymerase III subunit delta, partial [Planctomycetota bacterium]
MKPEALTTELSSDHVRPAYLLAGEETLFRDDALYAIRGVVLSSGPEDFNFERLDADKTSPGRLSEAVRALPVMANRRLVVLQGADARGAKALTDALSDVVAEVSAQDQTVLVVTAARASRASRWVKSFRDPAAVVECEPPKGVRALLACIRKEAASQEVS